VATLTSAFVRVRYFSGAAERPPLPHIVVLGIRAEQERIERTAADGAYWQHLVYQSARKFSWIYMDHFFLNSAIFRGLMFGKVATAYGKDRAAEVKG
jgi:hypothetical protein